MLFARYIGLVKDSVFTSVFGATYMADVFLVAFRFTNLLRVFFSDWTVYGTLVPELSNAQACCPQKTKILLNGFFSFMLVLVSGLVIGAELFAPYITPLLAPGFIGDPIRSELLVQMFRVILPMILFLALTTTLVSVQNMLKNFWIQPSFRSILDTTVIATILIGGSFCELNILIHWVAWSIIIAGIIQLFAVYMLCYRDGFKVSFVKGFWTQDLKGLVFKLIKTAFSSFGLYMLSFVGVMFASCLPPGQITYIMCVDRMMLLAVDAFGASITTILLTYVGKFLDRPKKLALLLEDVILVSLQLSLIAAVLVFFLSPYLVSALYGYGRFSPEDCQYVADVLRYYVWGMPAFALTRMLSLYSISLNRAGIACMSSVFSILISVTANWYYMQQGAGCIGIAIATVLALWGGILCYAPLLVKIRWQFGLSTLIWNVIHGLMGYLLWAHLSTNLVVVPLLVSYFVLGRIFGILRIGKERVLGL